MSYRAPHHSPGVARYLEESVDRPGLCPGCGTHVTWVGVPILKGMGVDLRRMKTCRFVEDHEEMRAIFERA